MRERVRLSVKTRVRAWIVGAILSALFALGFVTVSPAFAEFDSGSWARFREIKVPPQVPDSPAAIPLDASILEKSRPDLGDLRLVASDGSLVPLTIPPAAAAEEAEPFPVKVFRVAPRPGKWTDIWIDKTAKVLDRGILLQTPSGDFVRGVEIRGSDTGRESYVVRMDGLVADVRKPIRLRSLAVRYPVQNFQYVHIRILDEDRPPLKIDGVLCYPPDPDEALSRPIEARITENRADSSRGATTILLDLGEKRPFIDSVTIPTRESNFAKNVVLSGAASGGGDAFAKFHEGTIYRLRKEDAFAENLKLRFKPQIHRFVRIDISGGNTPPITVERIQATGTLRTAVFTHRRGEVYRLLYDNPAAGPGPAASAGGETLNPAQVAAAAVVSLGPEQRNLPVRRPQAPAPPPREEPSTLKKVAGIGMLLAGLVLLFTLMLRARSLRKAHREKPAGMVNVRKSF
jgi:hypothetical protein